MAGLRQRNRQATMEHIQDVALDLFEKRGYAEVTIAEIAEAADIGTTTFYRLFATKEGLFTASPWETLADTGGIDLDNLEEEVLRMVAGNEWPGMKWVIEEPDVRTAVLARLDQLANQLIDALVEAGQDRMHAAIRVRELLFATYFTSLEIWHTEGRPDNFETYFNRARALYPSPESREN